MHVFGPRLSLLFITVGLFTSGCNTTANLIGGIATHLDEKAQYLRLSQARRSSAAEEQREKARQAKCPDKCNDRCCKDKSGKLCHHHGKLQETLESELRIVLEQGLQFADYQLDFNRVEELKKEQARYDDEYEKAMSAWHDYEAENYRRHLQGESAMAKVMGDAESPDCLPVIPDCAFPPPKAYVKSPPPKRKVVGLEEIPIVIHANAKLNMGEMSYGKSQIRRELVKEGKEPCCPRCDTKGCVDRCDSCGYVPQPVAGCHKLAPVPPANDGG